MEKMAEICYKPAMQIDLANRWFQPLTHVSGGGFPRKSDAYVNRGKREKRNSQRFAVAHRVAHSVRRLFATSLPQGGAVMRGPRLVPITGKAARAFVADVHRHLPKLQGALFAVAVEHEGQRVGVGTAGNPARVWQGTGRFAITRVAVRDDAGVWHHEEHNAPYCTMIYGALCRAGKALGYQEAWTYTLPDEDGRSLRGAGFWNMGLTDGGEWSRPSRARDAAVRPEPKRRWVRPLTTEATIRIATPIMSAIAAIARRFADAETQRMAA